MTAFDFDTPVERRDTGSYKWDQPHDSGHGHGSDILPMWVADMDFRTAPCIIDALARRVSHGVFGYTYVPDRYYEALAGWWRDRHGLTVRRESVIYTSGVVPAVSAVIKALTMPGEGVVVQTPAYNCFFSSIRNNGCRIVANPLRQLHDGSFGIDFDGLAEAVADPSVTVMLLCNPHNPTGRVWTPEELRRIGEICFSSGVTVISDEIHCELVYSPHRFTPFASLGDEFASRSVTCMSPSKAFNTAGLQIANIVCDDPVMRRRIDRAININEVCDVNPFGVAALIAAYTEGAPWLEALTEYLWGNYLALRGYFASRLPSLRVTPLEGTYLAWVDCRALGMTSAEIEDRLVERGHVWINAGTHYGSAGEGFIRINIACPRARLLDGLQRICRGLEQ